MSKKRLIVIATIAVVLLVGCVTAVVLALGESGSSGDPLACKRALQEQFAVAMSTGQSGQKPRECEDLSDEVVAQLATEVISEAFDAGK